MPSHYAETRFDTLANIGILVMMWICSPKQNGYIFIFLIVTSQIKPVGLILTSFRFCACCGLLVGTYGWWSYSGWWLWIKKGPAFTCVDGTCSPSDGFAAGVETMATRLSLTVKFCVLMVLERGLLRRCDNLARSSHVPDPEWIAWLEGR